MPKFPENTSPFRMKGISPLRQNEKKEEVKKAIEMEFHPSLLEKTNVGPPYEKEPLGYMLEEVINPKSKKK